jgi:hypothetical protein
MVLFELGHLLGTRSRFGLQHENAKLRLQDDDFAQKKQELVNAEKMRIRLSWSLRAFRSSMLFRVREGTLFSQPPSGATFGTLVALSSVPLLGAERVNCRRASLN